MRRRLRNLIVIALLSIIFATFVTVTPAKTQNASTIISKLEELQNGIQALPDNAFKESETAEQHKNSLVNKISAVISQIEAGVYEGVFNKLEEDIQGRIDDWLIDPWKDYTLERLEEVFELCIETLHKRCCYHRDFSINASPTLLTIPQGGSNTSIITITSLRGFSEEVRLIATSPPIEGVMTSLYPSEVVPPAGGFAISLLTVNVATTAEPGNYVITVTGTSGKWPCLIKHSVSIGLSVVFTELADFSLSATPQLIEVQQGGSNTSIIAVTSLKGFNKSVNLTAGISEPALGVNITLNPLQVIPPSSGYAISILTVEANTTAEEGSYTITVNGASDSLQRSVVILLRIRAPPVVPHPDFLITAFPTSLTVQVGESGTSTIVVISVRGFNQTVNLTITSEPLENVNVSVDPSKVAPPLDGFVTSTLTVNVADSAQVGLYSINVTATSGMLESKSVVIRLEVTAPPKDTIPPTIVNVLRNPETPAYNESVTVAAFVYDEGGSGIKQIILKYSGGAEWTAINMTLSDGLYTASIPTFPFNTTVEYRVLASDNENNSALSSLFSYTVIDPYPPLLRIDSPAQGSYLSGTVSITVFMKDQNKGDESGFGGAELSINGTVVKTWEPPAPSEPDTYSWQTRTFGGDGTYVVKLSVRDKAGNVVEKSLSVTVDNTSPLAEIVKPGPGSYLRSSVLIKVRGSDVNFDKMEVRIDNTLVRTSTTSGSEVLEWNTLNYDDGVHIIELIVYDKAGNIKPTTALVIVDNTRPWIRTPSWSPKEPTANVDIQINVAVTDPLGGSGVKNVTLWFKNKTMEDWQPKPMTLKSGNWTVTLSNQSDTIIKFWIEAFDRAENGAKTPEIYEIQVKGAAGVPLALILALILIVAAIIALAAYISWRQRRRQEGAGPTPSVMPPSRPLPPPTTPPSIKAAEKVIEGYGMASFIVPAHNEENSIFQRIANAFENAARHKGTSEIIVVDDGSDDNTYEMAWAAVKLNREKHPSIPAKVVRHSTKLGKAEAILTGRNKASGEIITVFNGNATIL